MLWKCCTQFVSKSGKLSSSHRTGKGQFSFQSQRRELPKNVQTTVQLCSFHMLVKFMLRKKKKNLWCISDHLISRFGWNVPGNIQSERRMRINSQEMATWKDRHNEFARRMKWNVQRQRKEVRRMKCHRNQAVSLSVRTRWSVVLNSAQGSSKGGLWWPCWERVQWPWG